MAHAIRGAIKDYDWGIVDGLRPWSGRYTGQPQAELWFGIHPSGPSPLIDADGNLTGTYLGDEVDFAGTPVLVKLLAVARPLSVQVHPTIEYVGRVWDSPADGLGSTVLSDPYEKTEMLVALEPFEAFAGWRDTEAALAILEHLPRSGPAVTALAAGDTRAAIRALLAIEDVAGAVAALPAAVTASGAAMRECHAFAMVADLFPNDAGALLTPLLGFLTLAAGQAVYLPAGVPHSYIRGVGLEVMISSDNVLRLGLTSKQVLVEEALLALDLAGRPIVLHTPLGRVIEPAGAAFRATLTYDGSRYLASGSYRFILLIEGRGHVSIEGVEREMQVGTAIVLSAAEPSVEVAAAGLVAIVEAREVIR